MHHPPGHRSFPTCLVEARLFHHPRPVVIRTFPNTKRLLVRSQKGSWRQSYSWRLLSQYNLMRSTRWFKKLENLRLKSRIISWH
jgi:hypothetical protein